MQIRFVAFTIHEGLTVADNVSWPSSHYGYRQGVREILEERNERVLMLLPVAVTVPLESSA